MGKRGPKPVPTAMKQAAGSRVRGIERLQPRPEIGEPDGVKSLPVAAQAVWRAVVKVIAPGVLTKDNGAALVRYCSAYVLWREAAAYLHEHGSTYEITDTGGNSRFSEHPYVGIYRAMHKQMVEFEDRFGMTPAARARVESMIEPVQAAKPEASKPVLRIAQ